MIDYMPLRKKRANEAHWLFSSLKGKIVGVDCHEGPPVPIPNTVVKLISVDNTWLATARKDR